MNSLFPQYRAFIIDRSPLAEARGDRINDGNQVLKTIKNVERQLEEAESFLREVSACSGEKADSVSLFAAYSSG